jgi:hypothetical protein
VALDRRKADAVEREESFRRIVKERAESHEPRNLAESHDDLDNEEKRRVTGTVI